MVESSNTADTATFPDHTEGSHASNGVYNTYDDEFTLPKYINHYPRRHFNIIIENIG